MFYKDSSNIYRVREFDRYPWLDLGFGTRHAGLWPRGPALALHQVHSDRCVWAPPAPWPEPEARGSMVGEGDALVTDSPGVYLTIRTADCIPILIVDLERRAVAAVHAGWRGTVARIVQNAVRRLVESGSSPVNLAAAIGPGICGECYEVGPEVARQFQDLFPERSDLERKTLIDLQESNRRQLADVGVPAVYSSAPCTFTMPAEFHSYRRDGKLAGRMFAAVGVKQE